MTERQLPPSSAMRRQPIFPAGSSGIIVTRLTDTSLLTVLRDVAARYFPEPADAYAAMDADRYRQRVAEAQDAINALSIGQRVVQDLRSDLQAVLATDRILVQSSVYLRATRPKVTGVQENVGWHRESFYGPDMEYSVNVWMPIANVNPDNMLRYIPDSHLIPDDQIVVVSEPDPTMPRYSAGHRIGLLYAPKRIIGGVDLSAHRPFAVALGEVAIFSGQLIHGAAQNRSDSIRFSIDFRTIAKANLREQKDHFASGRKYFEEI